MPRKAVAVRDGISPRQFCCGCICFLGIVLVLQVCVLASLLRRLAEIHRPPALPAPVPLAVAPKAPPPAVPATAPAARTAVELPAAPRAPPPAPPPGLRLASGRGLALGCAVGLSVDQVLLFLASLLRASPCHVVLLTDQALSQADLETEGIDSRRVSFESVRLPLAEPWSAYAMGNARWGLFQDYLQRSAASSKYAFIQLSDVEDIAFQADPFEWAAKQPQGVHVFGDEPSRTVGAEGPLRLLLQTCYGEEGMIRLSAETVVPAGYTIGTSADVQQYVQRMVEELLARAPCQREGVDEAIGNFVVHDKRGLNIQVHDNRHGPVWTGGRVAQSGIVLDGSMLVVNADGAQYAVLHQYNEHEDLWRVLSERFLKGRRQRLAALDCSSFEVAPGDMREYDLTHLPADTQKDCCAACLGEAACGGFVFSEGRKHCWLKKPGGIRIPAHRGDDVMTALRTQSFGGLPGQWAR